MNKFWYKVSGLVIIAIVIIALFNHYHLWNYLSLDGFNHYNRKILLFKEQHPVEFTFIYIISYILLIACCIPGTILFDLLAGFLYNPFLGVIIVLLSYLAGAVLNFGIVQLLFKDVFHKKFAHLRYMIFRDGRGRHVAFNLIGLRFIPVIPFWILNILAAVLNIRLVTFIWTTLVGIIPTSAIYVFIGSEVKTQLAHHQKLSITTLTNPSLWWPLVCLALLVIIPNIYKMLKKK